jgi:hypothetical protein
VFDGRRCLTSLGGCCDGTNQSRIGVVMTAISAVGRLWTRSTLSTEPAASNMKAPGINERSSPTYKRTARSSARRRFTIRILIRMSQERPGGPRIPDGFGRRRMGAHPRRATKKGRKSALVT